MDYQKIYNQLIISRKNRIHNELYTEKHHILPKSLGGSDDHDNIVSLTYREHYLAHWLLTKIYLDQKSLYKLSCAFFMMSKSNNGLRISNSKLYERSKLKFKIEYSKFLKTEEGKIFIQDRTKKKVLAQQQNFIFHFYHEEYGDFLLPTNVLMKLFPEQQLNSSNLVKVGKGERVIHKGWILYSNKDLGIDGLLSIKKNKMSVSALNRFKDSDYKLEHKIFSAKGGKSQKGFKKHYCSNGTYKMAHLGTEKSNELLQQGYYLKEN